METKRPVFATTVDPRLPSISSLQAKHWRSMVAKNKYLGQVFPNPPLTGYRRQPNIRSYLIRAAIAKPERKNVGMRKCNKTDWTACPYIKEGKTITINDRKWIIKKQVNCQNYNIIYAIVCKKRKLQTILYRRNQKNIEISSSRPQRICFEQQQSNSNWSAFQLART